MCLLLVDDNPEMRRVIKRMLTGVATEIVECDDGSRALAAYALAQPEYVLMDIEMGAMDGITATQQITRAYPDARVIMLTGHGDEPLRVAATEAGACGYMLKENLLDLRELILSYRKSS